MAGKIATNQEANVYLICMAQHMCMHAQRGLKRDNLSRFRIISDAKQQLSY